MVFCCECGKKASRNRIIGEASKICNECTDKASSGTAIEEGELLAQNVDPPTVSEEYWANMNKLFDDKFKIFEEKLKDSILVEVKQITDPIQKEVNDLKAENKKLKSEVTLLKATKEEHKENNYESNSVGNLFK